MIYKMSQIQPPFNLDSLANIINDTFEIIGRSEMHISYSDLKVRFKHWLNSLADMAKNGLKQDPYADAQLTFVKLLLETLVTNRPSPIYIGPRQDDFDSLHEEMRKYYDDEFDPPQMQSVPIEIEKKQANRFPFTGDTCSMSSQDI